MGLVCGGGMLPVEFVRSRKENGLDRIVSVGVKGCDVRPEVRELSDHYEEVAVTQLGKLISIFKRERVPAAVMLGSIAPRMTIANLRLDWRLFKLALKTRDRRADSVLGAIAGEFDREGIIIQDTTKFLPRILLEEGPLCGPALSEKEERDVELGARLALVSGGHDIGQSVVVKDQAVVCVEAMEGTDRCIRRAGEYTQGAVVVKMAKPKQDLRFDVPCIGPGTMESMNFSHARVLAAEAGRTFLLEPQKTLELAQRYGITIVGIKKPKGDIA